MPLPIEFKMCTLYPPVLTILNNQKYIIPGWIKIDEDVTLEQVKERWIRKKYKSSYIPTFFLEYIDIKVGDKFIIIDNGKEKTAEVVKLYSTCIHVLFEGIKYTVKKEFFIKGENCYKTKIRRLTMLKKQ